MSLKRAVAFRAVAKRGQTEQGKERSISPHAAGVQKGVNASPFTALLHRSVSALQLRLRELRLTTPYVSYCTEADTPRIMLTMSEYENETTHRCYVGTSTKLTAGYARPIASTYSGENRPWSL